MFSNIYLKNHEVKFLEEIKKKKRKRPRKWKRAGTRNICFFTWPNCREYKIGGKVDGTVSKQVKNELSCCLVICDYGKVQELYETSATRR